MKIVLLGYMGSGKSFIGQKLAQKMNLKHYDLDEYIERKEQMSIAKIFSEKGEVYFRKIEHIYLKEIVNIDQNFVLSLGGGTPCYFNNMDMLLNNDIKTIYLKTSVTVLVERLLKETKKRPLIANLTENEMTEFVAKHLFERNQYYHQAKHIITTDCTLINALLDEIVCCLA